MLCREEMRDQVLIERKEEEEKGGIRFRHKRVREG